MGRHSPWVTVWCPARRHLATTDKKSADKQADAWAAYGCDDCKAESTKEPK